MIRTTLQRLLVTNAVSPIALVLVLALALALLLVSAGACSCAGCADDEGKANGELCSAHVECASGLCTVVGLPEAGLALDGGATPPKRCAAPSL